MVNKLVSRNNEYYPCLINSILNLIDIQSTDDTYDLSL